jgi:hypothetical protein
VDLRIRLDALSFNTNASPALIGGNREHETVVVADLEPDREVSLPGVFVPIMVARLFSFAKWASISAALVECSFTLPSMRWRDGGPVGDG